MQRKVFVHCALVVLCTLTVAAQAQSFASVHYSRKLAAFNEATSNGHFQYYGKAPIVAAHITQIPKTKKFLMVDFLNDGDTHPRDHDVKSILQVLDLPTKKFTPVPVDRNLVCGGWAKTAEGHIVLSGGHVSAQGVQRALESLYVYNIKSNVLEPHGEMTTPRWYPSSTALPDGSIYTFGGTKRADAFDDKSEGADIFTYNGPESKSVQVPVNAALMEAGIGNYYAGVWVLPTGDIAVLNSNTAQVINYKTGAMLAAAPKLPAKVGSLRWEYPFQGSTVKLLAGPMGNGPESVHEFVVFGGSDNDKSEDLPCSPWSLRIALAISASGDYKWGEWEVETAPSPRCMCDTVLLPNGNMLIFNGAKTGHAGLAEGSDNKANDPNTEVWLYEPNKDGNRFTALGVRSDVARLYHSSAILTDAGDVLIGGCSNCGGFEAKSPPKSFYSVTSSGGAEYRLELFKPSYLSLARPKIASHPAEMAYGKSYNVAYTFGKAISSVVLLDPGTVTHGQAMDARGARLAFKSVGKGTVAITSPASVNHLTPGMYLLFLVSGDSYSLGQWVQLEDK